MGWRVKIGFVARSQDQSFPPGREVLGLKKTGVGAVSDTRAHGATFTHENENKRKKRRRSEKWVRNTAALCCSGCFIKGFSSG